MLTADQLRAQFPAFVDSSAYPDAEVAAYLGAAYTLLNADRWGASLDFGAGLFVRHFLALDALGNAQGVSGVPGTAIGVLSGATVDKVSYTRDVSSIMEAGAGHWNMTVFGLQFIRFARMFGAGPIQVGAPGFGWPGQSAVLFSGAWPGPGVPTYW